MTVIQRLAEEVAPAVVGYVHTRVDARRIRTEGIAAEGGEAQPARAGRDEFRIGHQGLRVIGQTVLPRAEITIMQEDRARRNVGLQFLVIFAHGGIAGGENTAETPLSGGVEDVVIEFGTQFLRRPGQEIVDVRHPVVDVEDIVVHQALIPFERALHLDQVRMVVLGDVVAGDILEDVVHQQHEAEIVLRVVVLGDAALAVEVEVVGEAVAVVEVTAGVVHLVELHDGLLGVLDPAGGNVRPPAVVPGQVGIARAHTTAVDLVVLDQAAVGAVDKDAVAADVVHIVSPDDHVIASAAADDAAFVHSLDAVALDEHVIDHHGSRRAGDIPSGCHPGGLDQDGRAAVADIAAVAAELAPDVVDVVVANDEMVGIAGLLSPHHDALAADADLVGLVRDDLHSDHLPVIDVLQQDAGAFRVTEIDDRALGAAEGGEHDGPLRGAGSLGHQLPVESLAGLEEDAVSGQEGHAVDLGDAPPSILDGEPGGGIVAIRGDEVGLVLRAGTEKHAAQQRQ